MILFNVSKMSFITSLNFALKAGANVGSFLNLPKNKIYFF